MQRLMVILVCMFCACFPGSVTGEESATTVELKHQEWRDADLRLGAHRGGRALWPEDTLFAYQRTIEKWPSALLEGDVHITADGEVVLMHDSTVERTTDGTGEIAVKTLAEMKALDAGYKFTADKGETFPYRGQGITVSTLGEVLQAIPDNRFMIEIKGGEHATQLTVDAIRAAGASNRVMLASMSPLYMHEVRTLAPEIATCYDYANALKMLTILRKGDWESYEPTDLMLAAEPTLIKQLSIVPSEIQAIREKGILYQVFTLNTEQAMREHIAIGLDSILTDRPDLLAGILEIK